MKVAIVSSRFPFPLEKGDKLRLYHQIKFLSQHHEIYLYALTEDAISKDQMSALQPYCKNINVYHIPKWFRYISLLRSLLLRLPFQVLYFYNSSIKAQIKNDITALQPDHIYCQLIRVAEYVKDLPFPKSIDYMDAFSTIAERNESHSTFITKLFYKIEKSRLRNYEMEISNSFIEGFVISEQDKNLLKHTHAHLTVIRNGVDQNYFVPQENVSNYVIGFVGNMGYEPNVQAVQYLCNEILPLLDVDYNVLIAGARPDVSIRQLQDDRITVTGYMDDIRDSYADCKIFVAPIFSGAGLQNKILEAMSMGIPCITTTLVNNAIGAKPDAEILIADDVQSFVKKINELLAEKSKYNTLRINALNFVSHTFGWDNACRPILPIINNEKG